MNLPISSYHAHIYYDLDKKYLAFKLREKFFALSNKKFKDNIIPGTLHDQKVGPHLKPMFQVAFKREALSAVMECLISDRKGFSVLIHPETGNVIEDHTVNAIWLGTKLELDLYKL